MIKLISVVVMAMGVALPAHAAWTAVIPSGANTLEYVTGGVNVSNGPGTGAMFIGRTFNTPAGGATRALSTLAVENYSASVGGNALAVTATRALGTAAIAEAAIAVGAAAYAGVQAGAVVNTWLGNTDVRIGDTRCVATTSGWQCDDGGPTAQFNSWKLTYGSGQSAKVLQGSSPSAVCSQWGGLAAADDLIDLKASYPNTASCSYNWIATYDVVSVANNVCTMHRFKRITFGCTNGSTGGSTLTDSSPTLAPAATVSTGCPASIDALNPSRSTADGSSPNADGKCPTGRYTGAADTLVKQRMAAYADPTKDAQMAADLMGKGQTINGAVPQSITGPAAITGTPTTSTTTAPNGSGGTSTTTTTTTPQTSYTYAPTSITYNISNTTTVNKDGQVTTTTGNDVPEQSDDCKLNPTQVSCLKAGDPPSDTVTPQHKDIAFAAEDLGFGGACPAPYVIPFRGWQLTLNYQPACTAAPLIRPGLIALTALSCLIMVVTLCGKS